MLRLASDVEVILIHDGRCPHCSDKDVDTDWVGVQSTTFKCNVCYKRWRQYSGGRMEMEVV